MWGKFVSQEQHLRSLTEFTFEIEGGSEIPESQQGPLGPRAELVPFLPQPVAETEVLGRPIDEISQNIGTYGMGGAGFFGLLLGKEWLTIALWGAENWLRFNDRILGNINYVPGDGMAPWDRDELTRSMIGRTIVSLRVDRTTMELTLSDGGELRLDAEPERRPIFAGCKSPRVFEDDDDLRRVVFLMPDLPLWV